MRHLLIFVLLLFVFAGYTKRFEPIQQSRADPIAQSNALIMRADVCGAANVLREGIRMRAADSEPVVEAIKLDREFLDKLSLCAEQRGSTTEMDAEARTVYEEALRRYAGKDPERKADLLSSLATYYTRTLLLGKAIPFLEEEIKLRKSLDNRFKLARAETSLALATYYTGERQNAVPLLTSARENAAKYFESSEYPEIDETVRKIVELATKKAHPEQSGQAVKASPTKTKRTPTVLDPEWVEYTEMIQRWMQLAAADGNVKEVSALYKLYESAYEQSPVRSVSYYAGAGFFAEVKDIERARQLITQGDAMLSRDIQRVPALKPILEQSRSCSTGSVELRAKGFAEAVSALEDCIERGQSDTTGWRVDKRVRYPAYLGLAYEGLGDLPKAQTAFQTAIRSMETGRQAYSLAERIALYHTGQIHEFYWGLIRVAARRAEQSGNLNDFITALQASEAMRARQLGDQVASGETLTPDSIQELRSRLGPDEAVLIYTTMDQHLVLLAFTSDRHLTYIVEHDGKAFEDDVIAISSDMARSNSSMTTLGQRLGSLGIKLLGPVKNLIEEKKRLLVLPDGPLNSIPFDALSLDEKHYQPIINDYVVHGAPSLTMLLHQQRMQPAGSGLYALGDPVYSKPLVAAGFDRLPETQDEVKNVALLFKGEPVEVVMGEQAKESAVKRATLDRYRYLLFATHGIVGESLQGVREPAVLLAAEDNTMNEATREGDNKEDVTGNGRDDGFLTVSEVEKLKLNADLTVLSACNSAQGDNVMGEGPKSLSRAFLIAGSRTMVVSLWPVKSKDTEKLMVSFFRQLRGGSATAEALRSAKLELIRSPVKGVGSHEHPFYWAPFIFFGT